MGFNNLGYIFEVNNIVSEFVCDGSISFGIVLVFFVDWLFFCVIVKVKCEVELCWEMVQEDNNCGFSIEWSIDGKVFQEIGWVDS